MSGRSCPVNGGYEAASSEPWLSVRKDLFPESPDQEPLVPDSDEPDAVSCVKLETDFEQSIDDIASQKHQVGNGALPSPKPRHRKHKQHSRRDSERAARNGCLSPEIKRKKKSRHKSPKDSSVRLHVKGGKNLNLVSSSEFQEEEDEDLIEAESESSDDEVLKYSVKLPIKPRQSGKPYSHQLSQLSTKKSKSKDSSKERRTYAVVPCSGKPRSMLGICSSRSKKKKKIDTIPTYQSQIVDTNTIKITIRKTSFNEAPTPAPTAPSLSIADLGQRKSKKKRAASPVASASSGEEYFPVKDKSAVMSVAATKTRNPKPKAPKTKTQNSKSKIKSEKTERSRVSASDKNGPQSPWAQLPEEILIKIFEYAVASQGSLPTVIRLGRVCKLWHSVSCRPQLWKHMDLAQYTVEKFKTDYKLVWLLENRLSQCQSLNIAHWKESNITWVLACVVDYCPNLVELNLGGWCRITAEQLLEVVSNLKHLRKLDLSHTSETGGSGTCLSAASMAKVAEACGNRLTHLTLANNKFTALPQILSSLAAHCVHLEVLDISGALASNHPAPLPLDALQRGCPNIRVFRAANSQLVLAAQSHHQQESPGWTRLEELSIACKSDKVVITVGEYRFGDEALSRLVRGATALTLLDLRGLQTLTDSGLVRVPAWDLQHLFLAGCQILRQSTACLDLICEKWSHSLIELDLSWASATRALDDAVSTLADSPDSKLKVLNLCGSSVSLGPVKKVLLKCPHIESLNLSSCRALPRGMKRHYTGKELQDLKDSLDPNKPKPKNDSDDDEKKPTKKKTDDKKVDKGKSPRADLSESCSSKTDTTSQDKSSSTVFQQPKSVSSVMSDSDKQSDITKSSPDSKSQGLTPGRDTSDNTTPVPDGKRSIRGVTPNLLSPMAQSKPDSSSTPRSDPTKADLGSPHFSPVSKPDSQVQNSPEVQPETIKTNSWNLGHFKTTPSYKSEASPLNRLESHSKLKHGKVIEQCSPTTSLENKPSPETLGVKQDIKTPNNSYYNNYSPMPRQDNFSSQRSPYSTQPSPAQPSPYSTQPSPYSTQPSPYSSQPSPYSTQPSPDTSQIVKQDLQKSGAWNTGNYSPMPKQNPFSPHPSTHASPDPGLGVKSETLRPNPNKTPGQYSPMSRQDRIHQSPYSPRPGVDTYSNKKSPGVGGYSPMLRPDVHLPSPDAGPARPYSRPKPPEVPAVPDVHSWGLDRFGGNPATSLESLVGWAASTFNMEQLPSVDVPAVLNTPPAQAWPALPSFDATRRPGDPWDVGQFRVEPPLELHNTFVEQNVSFDSLAAHAHHALQNYLDEFPAGEPSRAD